ncbi:hypothetical protein ACHAP3_011064 [Botrytis cinerea]
MESLAKVFKANESSPMVDLAGHSTQFKGVQYHPSSAPADLNVAQFRGIKFGSIAARFRRATLYEDYPMMYDATKFGPACPQRRSPSMFEEVLNGTTGARTSQTERGFTMDEFECLNLVVTCPSPMQKSTTGKGLPVLVNIHGGGNVVGSNSAWFNDGTNLVIKSVEMNSAVVLVSLNYRLSAFGWLASEQLRQDNAKSGGTGVGNYGLEWVQRNIGSFGGDPKRVTLFGESAGAFGADGQIHSLLPRLFSRAILQSGVIDAPYASAPIAIHEQNRIFDRVMFHLQINTIEELRQVPAENLLEAFHFTDNVRSGFLAVPTIDNEFYSDDWKQTHQCAGQEDRLEIIIGNTSSEGTLWELLAALHPRSSTTVTERLSGEFVSDISSHLPIERGTKILKAYGVDESISLQDLKSKLLEILEDIVFQAPVENAACSYRKAGATVFRYVFEQQNPFEGMFAGTANHALDLLYVFGNSELFESLATREYETQLQAAMQEKWIGFANGLPPWKDFSNDVCFKFGPQGKSSEISSDVCEKIIRKSRWRSLCDLDFEQQSWLGTLSATYLYRL